MALIDYLTAANPPFGNLAWTFFVAQILGVAAGAYLAFFHSERNQARQTFMRQLGIALLIVAGVGVAVGVLRLVGVPPLNQRLWFYIQLLIELGVAGYVVYYVRAVLPGLAQTAARRSPRQGPPARSSLGVSSEPVTPRPQPTTSRRDARRDRKRRKG